jgi:hypothetical protein
LSAQNCHNRQDLRLAKLDLVRISTAEARRLLIGLVWWSAPTVRQVL